jgi:hypothetical protein
MTEIIFQVTDVAQPVKLSKVTSVRVEAKLVQISAERSVEMA